MDAEREARMRRKRELLRELAELNIEEMQEAGKLDETPHYGQIERAASELGKELSRETQERAAREVVANCESQVACPTCGTACDVTAKRRKVKCVDGPVELSEATAYCQKCRRSFFPSADGPRAR